MYAHTESRPQTTNRILNALTRSEYESLSPHFDPVKLSRGEILKEFTRLVGADGHARQGADEGAGLALTI